MKLIYFDFEDSFSWNIVKYLEDFFSDVEVVPLVEFEKKTKEIQRQDSKSSLPKVYVFGPGPKRPSDYKNLLPFIQSEIKNNRNFLVGICLGHQSIMQAFGFAVGYSDKPCHGIQISLQLSDDWKKILSIPYSIIYVQRYNSLCIREDENLQKINDYKILLDEQGEVMIFHAKNIISFQFHPESIGTKNPEYFFGAIKKLSLMYGKKFKKSKNGR
ncbi:MAG: aminodeoxychorismate/anthranilate synthase component II [Bacteriovoracaceae bacterium]|nr:aminodeoxychorismate/anthranilate synthase component II [Bacteriovoracaceae bacterium]